MEDFEKKLRNQLGKEALLLGKETVNCPLSKGPWRKKK
jgi:hypothetical protein